MKENIAVTKLSVDFRPDLLKEIWTLISGRKIMMVKRHYFFVPINGYSLYQACNYIDGLLPLITEIEEGLDVPELNNTRIIEKGLAINAGSEIVCDRALNGRFLDHVARHVRVPVSGSSTLNGISLDLGGAYIIDNRSGYRFTASKDCCQLVYSFVGNDNKERIWDLWRHTRQGK